MLSKLVRMAIFAAATVGAGACAVWYLLTPKIHLASVAEMRASVPKELLVEAQVDLRARDRYKKVASLLGSLNKKASAEFENPYVITAAVGRRPGGLPARPKTKSNAQRSADARMLWAASTRVVSQISSVLDSGPLQASFNRFGMTDIDLVTARALVKALATDASLSADSDDFQQSMKLVLFALKLSDRLAEDEGDTNDFMRGTGMNLAALREVDLLASGPRFPVKDCGLLLRAISPSPQSDDAAARALRTEFQHSALIILSGDPRRDYAEGVDIRSLLDQSDTSYEPGVAGEPFAGSYDAVDTAKAWATEILTAMANLRRPWSEYDKSCDEMIRRETAALPKVVTTDTPEGIGRRWLKLKYTLEMDNGHNTIGRIYLAGYVEDDVVMRSSCLWRTIRDATRVLLASRMYRASHGGRLPKAAAEFVPLVGSWPTDPYNGKPMIYLPAKQVVYCVGENLKDDGGDIALIRYASKDVGVSLELRGATGKGN